MSRIRNQVTYSISNDDNQHLQTNSVYETQA